MNSSEAAKTVEENINLELKLSDLKVKAFKYLNKDQDFFFESLTKILGMNTTELMM